MAYAFHTRLAKNITEDYLTCSICLNRYREPRTLPCEHSFCLQCLAEHIKDTQINGVFTCPMDRQQVKLPEDNNDPWECASSFENDTLLAGLIKALNETLHQKEDKKLEETEETLEFFCFGCKEVVTAESAVERHRKSTCDCVKLKKAFQRALPKIASLNKDLESMVVKTTKMKIESKKRAESAKNKDAIKEIESFESKLDNFYKQSKANLQSLKDGLCAPEESKADDKLEKISSIIQNKYESFNDAMENENAVTILKKYAEISNNVPDLHKKIDSIPKSVFRKNSSKFVPNEDLLNCLDSVVNCGHVHTIELSNFKARSDESVFNYYDIAAIGKYMIIIDGENGILKRYLNDCTYVDSLRLRNVCRVAVLSEDEIAVTRIGKKKITLVSIGRKMYVKGHIRTKKPYIGIVWLNVGGFAVSYYDGENPPGLEIISNEGKITKSILGHRNPNGNAPLFVCPMFMTTTTSGDIVLCDYSDTKHIMCFNQHLELLWCHAMNSMPCSASCDRYSLYVTLPEENEVIALYQENGEKMRTIIKESDGIERPYAIHWHSNVLAVTEDESDKIHLIHL